MCGGGHAAAAAKGGILFHFGVSRPTVVFTRQARQTNLTRSKLTKRLFTAALHPSSEEQNELVSASSLMLNVGRLVISLPDAWVQENLSLMEQP